MARWGWGGQGAARGRGRAGAGEGPRGSELNFDRLQCCQTSKTNPCRANRRGRADTPLHSLLDEQWLRLAPWGQRGGVGAERAGARPGWSDAAHRPKMAFLCPVRIRRNKKKKGESCHPGHPRPAPPLRPRLGGTGAAAPALGGEGAATRQKMACGRVTLFSASSPG